MQLTASGSRALVLGNNGNTSSIGVLLATLTPEAIAARDAADASATAAAGSASAAQTARTGAETAQTAAEAAQAGAEAVGTTTDGIMTGVDGNAASAFRVQSDARLSAEYATIREAPLSPYRYGFVGDGVADDTVALQATLDALPANGGAISLPHPGNARITAPLVITVPTKIIGRGSRTQRIVAAGCDAFHIAINAGPVHLEGFEMYTDRWNVTPHTLVGVKALGTDVARMTAHIYRDLFFDGFQTAIQVGYMWESTIEGITCSSGQIGVDVYGLSVNNTVTNCNLNTSGTNSRSIRFSGKTSPTDATPVTAEGWMISNNVLYGGDTNLELTGVRWFNVGDNIIDWSGAHGILINSNATYYGGNHRIHDNFIASYQGTAGVRVLNQLENPGRSRNSIHDNEIVGYGTGVTYGILLDGACSSSIVHSNTIKLATANDINVSAAGSKVYANELLSAIANNLYAGSPTEVFGNTGTIQTNADDDVFQRGPRGRRTLSGTASPATGTWAVGDRKQNSAPSVGQPKGWACTVAGTPGTWVSEGLVDDPTTKDTGRRDITALMPSGIRTSNPNMKLYIHRVGPRVTLSLTESAAGSATGTVTLLAGIGISAAIGTGFAPYASTSQVTAIYSEGTALAVPNASLFQSYSSPALAIYGASATTQRAEMSYNTNDAWPTTLPGTAA